LAVVVVLTASQLHTLVGAGAAEGAMDASNMLKPPLARGELHCVVRPAPDLRYICVFCSVQC
jgi:ATP-dependent Clp protease ATP-binding subunit ClpA